MAGPATTLNLDQARLRGWLYKECVSRTSELSSSSLLATGLSHHNANMSEYEVTSFEVQTTTDLAAGPPPIGIKYYELSNSGAGIVIYPQLRSASNPAGDVFWDGRGMKGFGYLLPIGRFSVACITYSPRAQGRLQAARLSSISMLFTFRKTSRLFCPRIRSRARTDGTPRNRSFLTQSPT